MTLSPLNTSKPSQSGPWTDVQNVKRAPSSDVLVLHLIQRESQHLHLCILSHHGFVQPKLSDCTFFSTHSSGGTETAGNSETADRRVCGSPTFISYWRWTSTPDYTPIALARATWKKHSPRSMRRLKERTLRASGREDAITTYKWKWVFIKKNLSLCCPFSFACKLSKCMNGWNQFRINSRKMEKCLKSFHVFPYALRRRSCEWVLCGDESLRAFVNETVLIIWPSVLLTLAHFNTGGCTSGICFIILAGTADGDNLVSLDSFIFPSFIFFAAVISPAATFVSFILLRFRRQATTTTKSEPR